MVMMRAPRDGEVCWFWFVIDYRVVGLIDECFFFLVSVVFASLLGLYRTDLGSVYLTLFTLDRMEVKTKVV